jgi:hypothetical protein
MSKADAHEIIPRLWLGNARSSVDDDFIRRNHVEVVFNCTKNLSFSPIIPTKYRIPVDDNLKEDEIRNMELWAGEIAYRILSEYKQGKVILVHCAAGMQRSAASVAFVLIALYQFHYLDAIHFIKEKRPIAFHPQANFERAIQSFDQRFHSEILPQFKKLPYSPKNNTY